MEGLLHNSMRAIWKAEKLVLQSITQRVDSQMVLGGINLLDFSEVREGNRKGTERTVTQWRPWASDDNRPILLFHSSSSRYSF